MAEMSIEGTPPIGQPSNHQGASPPADAPAPVLPQDPPLRSGTIATGDDALDVAGSPARRAAAALTEKVGSLEKKHKLLGLGVAVYDCETATRWSYGADKSFHAASTMKVAVLLGVFRKIAAGELRLDDPLAVRNRFISIADGKPFSIDCGPKSEPKIYRSLGKTMTIRELAHAMITTSSNMATNLLIDLVGVAGVQAALEENGVRGVKVLRGVDDKAAFAAGLNNEATAHGLASLMRVIADDRAYGPQASAEMRRILFDQAYRSGIPAGVPKGARVANKTGNISGIFHDVGLVYLPDRKPYVLVVLTQFDKAAKRGSAIADVSREVASFVRAL
jgi:beta-lactamase class A